MKFKLAEPTQVTYNESGYVRIDNFNNIINRCYDGILYGLMINNILTCHCVFNFIWILKNDYTYFITQYGYKFAIVDMYGDIICIDDTLTILNVKYNNLIRKDKLKTIVC